MKHKTSTFVMRIISIFILLSMMLSNIGMVGAVAVVAKDSHPGSTARLEQQTTETPAEPTPTDTPEPTPTEIIIPTTIALEATPEATQGALQPTPTSLPTEAGITPTETPVQKSLSGGLNGPLGSSADFVCTEGMEIPKLECEALKALYINTTSDTSNWTNHTGWLETNVSPCLWHNVNCTNSSSSDPFRHVTGLWLEQNNLNGTIPNEIGNLKYLDGLGLWDNNLIGSIPIAGTGLPGLDSLTKLSTLLLNNNHLSGDIPHQLGSLTSLNTLNLGWNDLKGDIPTELGNLTNLTKLHLNTNSLAGSIPSELGQLTNLKYLSLNNNQLSGPIPATLVNLTLLTEFYFDNNTSLCKPDDAAFQAWLESISNKSSASQCVLNPGTISGKVTLASNGAPLEGVQVFIHDYNTDERMGDSTTNTDGNYTVANLPAGTYRVMVLNYQGYSFQYYNQTTVRQVSTKVIVTGGKETPDINFALVPGGTISGEVTAASGGAPLGGVQVFIHDFETDEPKGYFKTGSDGLYSVANLPAGTYRVMVVTYPNYSMQYYKDTDTWWDMERVVVTAGEETTNINFALVPGGTISGKVFDAKDGTPLANILVQLQSPQGGIYDCTREDGSYSFNVVPYTHLPIQEPYLGYKAAAALFYNWCPGGPNTYVQQFWNSGDKWDGRNTWDSGEWLQVTADRNYSGVDFKLESTTSVPVTSATGGVFTFPSNGAALTKVEVPPHSVNTDFTLIYTPTTSVNPPLGNEIVGQSFLLKAEMADLGNGDWWYLPFNKPLTITVKYNEADLVGVDETTLDLYYWDESLDTPKWALASTTCAPSTPTTEEAVIRTWVDGIFTLQVKVCHFTEFATMAGKTVEPPAITLTPSSTSIDEGGTFTASGSFIDPTGNSWTASSVDYGDGSPQEALTLTEKTFTLSHVYVNTGLYSVKVTVSNDQDLSSSVTLAITVKNVLPMIITSSITLPIDPQRVTTSVNASALFTHPGTNDTTGVLWDWGDGKTSDGIVSDPTTATGSHIYTTPGVYTVTLKITDKDGSSYQATYDYVVIYDSVGDSVKGSGWFATTAGTFMEDRSEERSIGDKAKFGFKLKYKKDSSVLPTGEIEFNLKKADLKFISESFQWLVVDGQKAIFKGVGKINKHGSYGFLASVIEGGKDQSDKMRMKIWDLASGQVVYDNQPGSADNADPVTVIGGGSIKTHD
jgi:Leucine-rich repeat (LRR) protein/PKD repeat protein